MLSETERVELLLRAKAKLEEVIKILDGIEEVLDNLQNKIEESDARRDD